MNEIAKERLTLLFKNPKCPAWFANEDHMEKTVDFLVDLGVLVGSTRRVMPQNK